MHTPDIPVLRRPLRTHRRALACLCGGAVITAVVIANQPRGGEPRVAAGPVRVAAATPAPRSHPTPTPSPPPRLLAERIAFEDRSHGRPPAPAISAGTGILVDVDAGTILWERDPHRARAPASTVKVLSSLVALENLAPDQVVTVTPDALSQAGDETRMGLLPGQRLTVRDLLSGMLTVSANDAATALAVDTLGMSAFIRAMNEQEAALGLQDSRFASPVGLDDPGTQASAYDLAAIADADVQHFDMFLQLVSQTDIELPATAGHPAFSLPNLNRLLQLYPPAVGIKPGWTGDAGPCLVAMAVRDGHRLIAVLLGDNELYTDARALLDWGFVQEGLPTQLQAAKKR